MANKLKQQAMSIGQFLKMVDQSQDYKVQFGQTTTTTVASGGNANFSVTFPTAFTAAPIVLAVITGETGTPLQGAFMTAICDTITTTGFTLRLGNQTGSTSGQVGGAWIAIGY